MFAAHGTMQPFSWKAGLLFLASGIGLTIYFRTEKERMARKRVAELSKGVGKPKVGGPLTGLVDHNDKTVNDDEFLGKYRLVGIHAFAHTLCEEALMY